MVMLSPKGLLNMFKYILCYRDLYLGSLFATEKKRVYGYVTNTRIKFIIIVHINSTVGQTRDNEIRQMFRRLHTAYTQLLSNPFYTPGEEITSKRFESVASGLMMTK
jgi:hypothetical protein